MTDTLIHPSAVIDPGAKLGAGVQVGAFTLIGAEVEIGDGTIVGPHCSITGPTTIGRDNHFVGHVAVGGQPQDKKFAGERTELVIGDRNVFREFVTLNRGTVTGTSVTRIGNDNWLLAYTHVAHDCDVGNHCVFSNNTTLAGHVTVGDWVIFSGFSGAHQFCRVGDHAFIGMGALLGGDVTPFTMVAADEHGRPRGINSEGLKRRGFDAERISAIKRAYRTLFVAGLPLAEAQQQLAEQAQGSEDVKAMLDFITRGERRLLR
ncbi:acyl-[acyl-carrier-protein]--UDP-N-acetylglucosamine O-acyltransferase [Pseudoxanthomonas sp. GM95]|uniref:acyl-ACP--UDP-N-acetylglucosamine O-acyltransferase n=1 Tax=Pseudoxanthomonas sp. GM95 TaxID=1881043 RepID=UPI0008D2DD50|nr:acyl-ACP--UDP-N-acetylglucosamine O-acyltransferase [Pseudoxanthomonas sp. GM95]SEL83171.1 acyl-[acyl-carrier-protein]--UDP-N-acetylglucosamine O-acyltransferase [Pseudoxanthomonas sp. GM95]